MPKSLQRAPLQRPQAGQGAHQCRLARAVGAQQRDELAGADREVDLAHDGPSAEHHGAVAQLDHRVSVRTQQRFASWRAARLERMRER